MTSIQITVQLDSDAFADHTGTELARILTAYADRIRYDAHTADALPAGYGIARDVNGHACVDVLITEPNQDDNSEPAAQIWELWVDGHVTSVHHSAFDAWGSAMSHPAHDADDDRAAIRAANWNNAGDVTLPTSGHVLSVEQYA